MLIQFKKSEIMSLQSSDTEKINLIDWLIHTNNPSIMDEVKAIREKYNKIQQKTLERAQLAEEQITNNETKSHNEVKERFKKWL